MPRAQDLDTTFYVLRGWTAIARVIGPDGNVATPGSTTSIQAIVQRVKAPGTPTHDAALTVGTVVKDPLVTRADDSRWTKDDVGYNFIAELPASAFPSPDHYVVEFRFTPSSGADYSVIYKGGAKSTYNG